MLQSLSLTSRLTLFFTVVSVIVVLGLGWLFMVATNQHFIELDHAALKEKKELIEDILRKTNSADDSRWRLNESLSHHHSLFVSVKNPSNNEILFQSKGIISPTNHTITSSQDGDFSFQSNKNGRTELHIIHFKTIPKYNPAIHLDVTVALDTEHHQQFLLELQHSLAVYAVLATLVSGLLGWIAAHQGMAPLRAMKTRAAGMTGHQVEERMPVQAVPVEMADLAKELNQMLDRLQQDFRRLSEFSSDLAHELRTPISNLLTQTQVTLSAKRDVDTYRDTLASNAEELQRMTRMVSDMLFLAKTEREVELPTSELFSVSQEVDALLDFYEAVAEEKQIKMSTVGHGYIQGDRLMFRRAVSNLLSNALGHTPHKGTVHIIITEQRQLTEVTVENSGEEIDPLVLPRLFDRFYRADPSRSHQTTEGTGLGLSITNAIVKAHKGTINVQSAHGKTCFTLFFPRQ